CRCQIRAQVVTDLSEKWIRKFLELLLPDARNLCELAFTLWTCPRHLAQCCIGKNNVSRDIAFVRDLSPERPQTLEEFFITFDLTGPWDAGFFRRCLDRLGYRDWCPFPQRHHSAVSHTQSRKLPRRCFDQTEAQQFPPDSLPLFAFQIRADPKGR